MFDYFSGMDPETRIDIHTQTLRKPRSANPVPYGNHRPAGEPEVEDPQEDELGPEEPEVTDGGLYRGHDLDMEWKTQSLPSLGRVSSEQTLESSGDEFAALRRNAPTRMLKSSNQV